MRRYLAFTLSSLLVLASCGGGGGGSSSSVGGGGGGGGGVSGPNVATLTVSAFQPGFVNIPFVTITVCAPSTNNCQTIDNIQVDTGSTGVRVIASVLNASLLSALPQQLVGATTTPVVECTQFADGYSWGPVVSADVEIASEKASGIPIQVIGSSAFTQIPADCSTPVPNEEDTVATFGANGIIGVGVFAQDCGSACASGIVAGTYYGCPTNGASCAGIMEPTNLQVSHPVAAFASDDNGVIIELPSVAAGGAASAAGYLVFGIGTESNNALGTATILETDPNMGTLTVTFAGTPYPESFLDSGSNAYYFTDNALSPCGQGTNVQGYFCTAANLSATITTLAGMQLTANFAVGDASTMFEANPTADALPQLAGPIPAADATTFDFGLPYFYGRNVFTAIEGMSAGGTMGPYVAY
ncbi:MAG TPA: DUF3443 family protein [Steroidobacteraceae bacterium]|nr:DUF3443 family protein [Steroidobacteraceae bacterium]